MANEMHSWSEKERNDALHTNNNDMKIKSEIFISVLVTFKAI